MQQSDDGWGWFEGASTASGDGAPDTLPTAFARCFRGPDADRVIRYLRALTLDRATGPSTSDAGLRHLEGQRQLVAHVLALLERGRNFPQTETEF